MGAIAKALERAGYLQPLGNAVQNYFQKKQQEEDFKRLTDAFTSSQDRINELNTGFDRNDITTSQFTLASPFTAGQINEASNQPMNDFVLGDVVPPEERYNRSTAEVNNFLGKGLLNENIDPKRLSGMTEVLSALANMSKPEYFNLGEGQERFARDPNTGTVSSIAKRDKPQTFDIEGKFENDATGTYWTYDKKTGKPIDTKIKFERTNKLDKEIDSFTNEDGKRVTVFQKPNGQTYERISSGKVYKKEDSLPANVNDAISFISAPEVYGYKGEEAKSLKSAQHGVVKRGLLTPKANSLVSELERKGFLSLGELSKKLKEKESEGKLNQKDLESLERFLSYYANYDEVLVNGK